MSSTELLIHFISFHKIMRQIRPTYQTPKTKDVLASVSQSPRTGTWTKDLSQLTRQGTGVAGPQVAQPPSGRRGSWARRPCHLQAQKGQDTGGDIAEHRVLGKGRAPLQGFAQIFT